MKIQQLVKPLITALCVTSLSACSAYTSHGEQKIVSNEGQNVFSDGKGMTYYTFDNDVKGSAESACYESCAATWPPVSSTSSKGVGYSTVTRKDGSKQLTFNGNPIYYFAGDSKAGERKGDGIGGVWHVVKTTTSNPSATLGYSY